MDLLSTISFLEVRDLREKFNFYNIVEFGASESNPDNRYSIQLALYAAKDNKGHSVVYVPPGIWNIKGTLYIHSNVTFLMAQGATLRRNANIDGMLRNDGDGLTGIYGQNKNIHFVGGTYDCNKSEFPTYTGAIAFSHVENILIKDAEFKDLFDWHYLEINAAKHVIVDNCRFLDYGTATTGTEAVQIDFSFVSGYPFAKGAPYDETFCRDVTIQNCYFGGGVTAIGTHSGATNKLHRDIKILNNYFENHRKEVIKAFGWSDVLIEGNYFIDGYYGIYLYTDGTTQSDNIKIRKNTFKNMTKDANGRAISLAGIKGSSGIFKYVNISENFVDTVSRHGIGANYSQYVIYRDNTITKCGASGLWIGYGGGNQSAIGNNCHGNNTTAALYTFDLMVGYEGDVVSNVVVRENSTDSLAMSVVSHSIVKDNFVSETLIRQNQVTNSIIKDNFLQNIITPALA